MGIATEQWNLRRRVEDLIKHYTELRDWDMVYALFMDLGHQMEEWGW